MNKKKLCAGSLALALSLGAVSTAVTSYTNPAYATSETDGSANAETNEEKLKKLEDEGEDVQISNRYLNATKGEQEGYDSALLAAKNRKDTDNVDTLLKNLQDAKYALLANSTATADSRSALASTIEIANKLAKNDKLTDAEKTAIQKDIDAAQVVLNDKEKLAADINAENTKLSQAVVNLAENKEIDFKNLELTQEELTNAKPGDNTVFVNAYNELFALQVKSVELFNANKTGSKLNSTDLNNFAEKTNAALAVLNNTNATLDDVNNAYNELNAQYYNIQTKLDENNTQNKNLRDQLTELTGAKRNTLITEDRYNKANPSAKLTYDTAVANANALLAGGKNPTDEELTKAIINIKLAELTLTPVTVKTLDDKDPSENTDKNTPSNADTRLKALVDDANNVRESDDFKAATEVAKKSYNDAITAGDTLLKDNSRTEAKVEEQIKSINDAKAALKSSKAVSNEITEARNELDRLTKEVEIVKKSNAYKNDTLKQVAYNTAINEATALLVKFANDNSSVSLKELQDASKKITDALDAMGYEPSVAYPTKLADLIAEAPTFRKHPRFVKKALSNNANDMALVNTYNEQIEQAKKYIDAGGTNAEYMDNLAGYINELKMAIIDQLDQNELALRALVREEATVKNSNEYKAIANSSDDTLKAAKANYDKAIADARTLLANTNRTKADVEKLADEIQRTKTVIQNPSAENKAMFKLSELIKQAQKVMADPRYQKSPQAKRDALKKAADAGSKITGDSELPVIERAISDLEAALNVDEYKEILTDKKSPSLHDLSISELTELARRVTEDKDFLTAPTNQKQTLNEALAALSSAVAKNNADDQNQAKIRVINALLQDKIKPITDRVLANASNSETKTELDKEIEALKALIATGNSVVAHEDYKNLDDTSKANFEKVLQAAKDVENSKDIEKVRAARTNLENALKDSKIKLIVDILTKSEKEQLQSYVVADETLRKTTNYIKAQKSLRDAYDKSIEEAKSVLNDTKSTDAEFKTARAKIDAAIKALDGNLYEARLIKLTENYNKADIQDASKKADIESKIKALESNPNATMDDLLAAEIELANATRLSGSSTPVNVKPVPTITTTTTTVPTTKQLPEIISPGSIVRTGIESLGWVIGLLVLALGGYYFLSKKDKNNTTSKTNRTANKTTRHDDKKTMTFEGDLDEDK